MKSKNKPPMTASERAHVGRLAALDICVVCDERGPAEIHEPEQGMWHIAIPLCTACHRGPDGWHGTRRRWVFRKMTELKAINKAAMLLETA